MQSRVLILLPLLIIIARPGLQASERTEEQLSEFAENVLLHVVLHELGHGLIREFDLPILGNEETMADAFATVYLTRQMPERAFAVIKARTDSLMLESSEVPRAEWTIKGEHNNDARRAYQIAAIAVAADPDRYAPIAKQVGMTDRDIRSAVDYGAEIHRSWRRLLAPVMMPTDLESRETRMNFDSTCPLSAQIQQSRLAREINAALRRFDWHSQITVSFIQGDGGAGWSRSNRTVTVNSQYVERFIRQGTQISD